MQTELSFLSCAKPEVMRVAEKKARDAKRKRREVIMMGAGLVRGLATWDVAYDFHS